MLQNIDVPTPDLAATIWSNYVEVASAALSQGQWRTARTMFAAALNEAENVNFCVRRQIASLHGLAYAEMHCGGREDSGLHLRKAFRLICQGHLDDVDSLGRIACMLADFYLEKKQPARALPVLKTACSKIRLLRGWQSPALIPVHRRMALIYAEAGRNDKADYYVSRIFHSGDDTLRSMRSRSFS
ncbi:MAG: hypothetical protein JSS86_14585 [Cyanobacteria bacterium SZAS LIN-2]|nr:hypothetical protein [Cyanobacteria bacterium SZAS LIN-3]MBS1997544.1 hypothetical protein [Cyanobacteria bacterium SZAS LIN-2]MBS2010632.1 hypothetical protein [Cyanobacteria bacterium SZAS TMP-1]